MTLLIQIDEDRVRLTAAGLFKVGMHLIPAVSISKIPSLPAVSTVLK